MRGHCRPDFASLALAHYEDVEIPIGESRIVEAGHLFVSFTVDNLEGNSDGGKRHNLTAVEVMCLSTSPVKCLVRVTFDH